MRRKELDSIASDKKMEFRWVGDHGELSSIRDMDVWLGMEIVPSMVPTISNAQVVISFRFALLIFRPMLSRIVQESALSYTFLFANATDLEYCDRADFKRGNLMRYAP